MEVRMIRKRRRWSQDGSEDDPKEKKMEIRFAHFLGELNCP